MNFYFQILSYFVIQWNDESAILFTVYIYPLMIDLWMLAMPSWLLLWASSALREKLLPQAVRSIVEPTHSVTQVVPLQQRQQEGGGGE